MSDKLEQAIAEYLKNIKVKSGGIANLPLFTDVECEAVSQGVAQAVRFLLREEPEALGLKKRWRYLGGVDLDLYALPLKREKP